MSTICLELEETLTRLEPQEAAALERLVRDALALVDHRKKSDSLKVGGSSGWPADYFELTAGAFAGEPLDGPADPPAQPISRW